MAALSPASRLVTLPFADPSPRARRGLPGNLSHRITIMPIMTTIHLVDIPPGCFWIGSPPDEPNRCDDEGPQYQVQLVGFQMGQTPITQSQWAAVMGTNPSRFCGAQRPVERVSWHDAMEFCWRLSHQTGRYYTLPSEAQWEYACRAGTTTPFAFGETLTAEQANYNSLQTTDVASFPANDWGLHDMHGNVWEWCLDHWHDSYEGAPVDGSAWLGKFCAAAPGSTVPGPAARRGVPATGPSLPPASLGSVWSASPRGLTAISQ